MMEAAVSKSAKLLETQIEMILHVRSAWQKLDAGPPWGAGKAGRKPDPATEYAFYAHTRGQASKEFHFRNPARSAAD